MHFLVAIVATLALLPWLATPSQASERTVARMGGLQATISQTTQWCGETVEVRVHAPDAAQLSDDTRQLQLLVGGVRQILGLECPAIQQLQLIGSVDGQTVGTWTHTAGGQLIAAQTANTHVSTVQTPPIGREEIAEAQQILSELGYEPGPVDGLMGQNTKRAIQQFQLDQRLALDGAASPQLLEKLRSVVAARQSGPAVAENTARPSFDCARAGNSTEYAICASPELARLDRQMADAYALAHVGASNPSAVANAQRNWISKRNDCGGSTSCLEQSMQQRIRALGGGAVSQHVDLQNERVSSDSVDALMHFDRGVYLIRWAHMKPSNKIVHHSVQNLDASDVEALAGAIGDAISADPIFAGVRSGPGDLAAGGISFNAYLLVAGDWRERITYAIESNFPDAEFSIIQIAREAGANPTHGVSESSQGPLPAADFDPDAMPLLRAWVSHYLDKTTSGEQIGVIEGHIRRLQQARDYSANAVFAEGEIEGRQPQFLARAVHGRWLSALEEKSIKPPFVMAVQASTRNLKYDFESGDLVLFGGDEDRRSSYASPIYIALRKAIIEAGGIGRSERLLGITPPSWPSVRLDRNLPTRFPMDAERVENMIANGDIVVFDTALRITSVDYEEGNRGAHGIALEAEILGVNVMTDAGVQIAVLTPVDMPPIVPEPVTDEVTPVHDTVHLARPRDLLAAIAVETGADAANLIESVYPATSQDSFDRQDEITDLATSSKDIDLGGFWMSGYGKLSDYDTGKGEYGLDYVVLTYPDSVSRNEKGIRRRDLLRLANISESSGVRFAMPEEQARRLRDAIQGSDAYFRAKLAVRMSASDQGIASLPLTAELVELVVLRPGSDPEILNDDEIVARIGLEPSSSAQPDDESVAHSNDGPASEATSGYDILGVRVGQPLAAGLSQLQTEFAPETILYGRREIWIDADHPRRFEATTPLAESVIMARNGARDFLTIFHEPLVEDDPITGLARTITFVEGERPVPDAIRDLMIEKYGEIGSEHGDGVAYLWTRIQQSPISEPQGELSMSEILAHSTEEQYRQTDRSVCGRALKATANALDSAIQSSRIYDRPVFDSDYPLVDDAQEKVPYPEERPLWPLVMQDIVDIKCNTDMVLAAIQHDDVGLVAALRVLVTNRAYLATIEAAAQALSLKRDVVEQTVPEIDF